MFLMDISGDFFFSFLGLNPYNFARYYPNIKNTNLFYAKCYVA